MKKELLFISLGLLGFMMASCDPSEGSGGKIDDTTKNYWERSALNHLQLRGPVKSVKKIYSDTTFMLTEFDERGIITKEIYVHDNGSDTSEYVYNALGQLVSNGYEDFEYNNHGKYIPRTTLHLNEAGLTPNLSRVSADWSTTSYIFDRDTLLIINSYQYDNVVHADTNKFEYSGKYPVRHKYEHVSEYDGGTNGSFVNISYADNGMFKVYSEGFFATGINAHQSTRTTTYKLDDEFMLPDTHKTMSTSSYSEPTISTKYYTYNQQKDITQTEEDDYIEEYSGYVYDTHNNWINRNRRYQSGDYWSEYTEERREITYWE